MSQLICELCGKSDFLKQDGVFVCQDCGTKYTLEEAKRMLENNKQASLKQEKTELEKKQTADDEIEKLYLLARRYRESGESSAAIQYYNMIMLKNPNDWEAHFYVAYFRGMQCPVDSIETFAKSFNYNIRDSIRLIEEQLNTQDEKIKACTEVSTRVIHVLNGFQNAAESYFAKANLSEPYYSKAKTEYVGKILGCVNCFLTLGNSLDYYYSADTAMVALALVAWKKTVEIYSKLLVKFVKDIKGEVRENGKKEINAIVGKIRKYDASYQPPATEPPAQATNGGCYVATCVYGAYDCPEVWILRRFRDDILSKSWCGRTVIRVYYAVSPAIVRRFGKITWMKRLWKIPLDVLVNKLQQNGVQNTPYQDKKS